MNKTTLYMIVSLILITVLIYIVLFVPGLNQALKQENSRQLQSVGVIQEAQQCTSLTTGCDTKIDGLSLALKFPKNIIYLNSFPIEVSLSGDKQSQIENVKIEFRMLKMNMGINYYQLQQDRGNKILWKGNGVLPICVTGRTDWQAHVEVKIKDKIYKTVFQFEVLPST